VCSEVELQKLDFQNISTGVRYISAIISIFVAISIVTQLINSVFDKSSLSTAFYILEKVQLILLIPLLHLTLPPKLIDFYHEISWTLLSFTFLDIKNWPGVNYIESYLSQEQTDMYAYMIGIESESMLMNCLGPIL
jgi:hypothetical protein